MYDFILWQAFYASHIIKSQHLMKFRFVLKSKTSILIEYKISNGQNFYVLKESVRFNIVLYNCRVFNIVVTMGEILYTSYYYEQLSTL